MRKVKVLIIEDSKVVRLLLEETVRSDPRLEIAASVSSAEEGLELLPDILPDVISLDIRLPGMNGLEATLKIMSEHPVPIVVISSSVEKEDLKISMNALKAGALAILEKPSGVDHADYKEMAGQICDQLFLMSQVKVIRQRRPSVCLGGAMPARKFLPRAAPFEMVGIAASTGGPAALEKLLSGLPSGFPAPILLVQHITAGFLEGFAAWLEDVSSFPVSIVRGGEIPAPSRVYMAPADFHLILKSGRLALSSEPPFLSQRPSGTVLFRTMAREMGRRVIGVILTGMGEDGAEGLLEIKRAGGYVIAEARSTAVVYGMPEVAVRLGAVDESLPVDAIAPRLAELFSQKAVEREASG